ncbi:MAG: hypothetical protein ACI8PQ_001587, partial [Planctomycetota bacterium]
RGGPAAGEGEGGREIVPASVILLQEERRLGRLAAVWLRLAPETNSLRVALQLRQPVGEARAQGALLEDLL